MRIHTFDPKKNKHVLAGTYNSKTKEFTKKVNSKHYMIKEKGYGIQSSLLDELMCMGCETIYIVSKLKKYKSCLEDWLLDGIARNYGHGLQVFLKVSEMKEVNNG